MAHKEQYRVAIIGCGGRAREHMAALQTDPRCKVVALVDVRTETAEKLNADGNFSAKIYNDHREMLHAVKPDVVVSCLWTPLHLPIFRDCVEANVMAVLSEKPMAPTWGECLELAQLAEQSGTLLTFCHQRRFAAGNQMARKLIAEGVFGDPLRMDLYSPKNLLDCGTHTFDQAMSFNNESPVKWIMGAVDASELLHWFNVAAECMAVGTLVFANGVRANIQVGGPDMDMWSGVRWFGTKGFFEILWDGQFGKAAVYDEPSWAAPVIDEPPGAHMLGVVRNALDCIESGDEPELSYHKALRAEEAIFALYESVRTHRRVELPISTFTDNPFHAMLESGQIRNPEGI